MKAKLRHIFGTPTAKKIRLAGLSFALLFSGCALSQYWFIKWQNKRTARQEFRGWSEEIKRNLSDGAGWNLKKFRQADWSAPGCFLYTTNGLLLDVEGFLPGFLGQVTLPDGLVFDSPTNLVSQVGEAWRVLARKVDGGTVLLATDRITNKTEATDAMLLENAKIFGLTLDDAEKIRPKDVDRDVDYSVLDSSRIVRFMIGGVPLRVSGLPVTAVEESFTNVISAGRNYTIYSTAFQNGSGECLGLLSIPRDGTPEAQATHSSVVFNVLLASVGWLMLGALSAIFLIKQDRQRPPRPTSLETALARGEGQDIEFKGGIVDGQLANSIAAFANTNHGCIFIGVQNNGGVSGLRERTIEERDELLRKIHDIGKRLVDPRVLPTADFIDYQGKTVLRLFVLKGANPPYVVQGSVYRRFLATVSHANADDIRTIIDQSRGT